MKKRILSLVMAMIMLMSLSTGMTLRDSAADEEPVLPSAPAAGEPVDTEEPEAAEEPETTEEPEATEVPAEATEEPEITEEPEATEVPAEATEEPEVTGEPAEAEVMTLGLENEPMTVANEFNVTQVNYWASGALIIPALDRTNVFAAYVNKGFTLEGHDFGLTVDGESISLGTPTLSTGNSNDYVWWDGVTLSKGGTYTFTITEKEEPSNTKSASVDIYKVTFDPGEGIFEGKNKGDTFVAYGMKDSRWERFGLPSSPKRESDEGFNGFLGWAANEGVTTYSGTASNLAGALGGSSGSHEVTVYAAYGEKKVYRLEAWKDGKPVGDTLELVFGLGNETDVKLEVKNTGNQPIPGVRLLPMISNYTLTADDPLTTTLEPEGSISLTLKPNKLGVGSYTDALTVNASGGSLAGFRLVINTKVIGTSVTVKPEAKTKHYGETIDPKSVKVETDPADISLSQLGITLRSAGFAADAEVGEYEYTFSGGSGYTIDLDTANKVTVEQATPRDNGVNATGIYEGETLSKSTLSGSFINPYTDQTVIGELKWDDVGQVVNATGDYDWTFTPNDTRNYTTVSGTAHVVAGKGEATEIILEGTNTFQYNGRSQGLQFTTSRVNDNTPIVVEYLVDDEWTKQAPKNVGTYSVRATIESTPAYERDEHTDTLTITPAPITPNFNVTMAKPYDGTTKANVTLFSLNGRFGNDDVSLQYTAAYETKNAGSSIITLNYEGLTGADAGNYTLTSSTKRESGIIYTKAITITANDITKEYGEELILGADMFTATGLVDGESLADQHVDYASAGTASAAEVGTYPVTARAHGGNYTTGPRNNAAPVEVQVGNMKVVPAEPVEADGGVKAGEGKQGGKLKDVALNGSFVNPHDRSMLVEGTLEWEEPETDLPLNSSTTTARWKFTPTDKNYEGTVSGEVTITLLSLPTVHVTADNKTVEYNGEPRGIDPPIVAAADKDKVALEIEYRLHKDIVTTFALENTGGHDDFTTEEPVDAGTYDVHVHVNVLPAFVRVFASDLLQPTLIITPAKPDVTDVKVDGGGGFAVPEGTALADVTLTGAKDLEGKPLAGTFAWDHPYTTVAEAGDYSWTFTPDDPNYAPVSGSSRLTLAEDTRTIKAVIYNLPNSLGYGDYAVVDVENSGLKAGDVIVFYKDGSDPVCEPVTITEAHVNAKTLTVELDDDALSAEGGSLTSSISSSSQHTADPVDYKPEMGFTVPETLVTYPGHDEVLDIVEVEGYEIKSVSISANTGDFITVEQPDAASIDHVIHARRAGSTTLAVSLTFAHPDPAMTGETITITKTVHVAVETSVGDLTVTKTVAGSQGEKNRDFKFRVTLTDPAAAAEADGGTEAQTVTYGDVTFTDGVGEFTLCHGQSVSITGIPERTEYIVEELDADGYTVTKTGDKGEIKAGENTAAAFTNTKDDVGGSGSSTDKNTKPADSTVPATGDGSMPGLWLALLALCSAGLAVTLTVSRRSRKRSR